MLVEFEIFPGGYGPPTRKVFVEADTVVEVVPYRKNDCEVRLRDGSSYVVKSHASAAALLINAGKDRALGGS